MNEYWVNVYEPYNWATAFMSKHSNRLSAINHAFSAKCIYRIHVKMKPVKPLFSGQYIRSNALKRTEKWLD